MSDFDQFGMPRRKADLSESLKKLDATAPTADSPAEIERKERERKQYLEAHDRHFQMDYFNPYRCKYLGAVVTAGDGGQRPD